MKVAMYNIRSGAIRWQIHYFLSDGNSNVCIFQRLLVKIALENFNLESVGQGHEYNFFNDAIRWQISKSTKVTFYIFDFR